VSWGGVQNLIRQDGQASAKRKKAFCPNLYVRDPMCRDQQARQELPRSGWEMVL
jgi:hypothetical protein